MKLGSLFDGSGGFPLAATMCGIIPVWASEVEPYPIAVTRSRFPKMRHLGDVSKVNGAEIEPVDIITFGSPCQDLSVAGKIDVINNICNAVHNMNAEPRSSADRAEKPVWKETSSVVHTDYADGSAETKTVKHAAWRCPVCGWFVGEQVDVFGRKHNQTKKNFCDRCGQRIDWESVEKEEP